MYNQSSICKNILCTSDYNNVIIKLRKTAVDIIHNHMDLKKRYWVFAYPMHYPYGSLTDIVGTFDSLDVAKVCFKINSDRLYRIESEITILDVELREEVKIEDDVHSCS